MVILCLRLNFADFSAPVPSFSVNLARFALPYCHLAQVLQDLHFRTVIWLKSCRICTSVPSFSSSLVRFALPYRHLVQVLQDLHFRTVIWLKSCKIRPSVPSFDINKRIFKLILSPIFKPKKPPLGNLGVILNLELKVDVVNFES